VKAAGAAAAALVMLMASRGGEPAQDNAAVVHEYADVNGVRLHYARTGTGPLIVFVHGFPEFWYEWTHQLAEFGKDHLAVAPDMRGYNLSSKPTALDDYQIPKLVEDLHGLTSGLLKTSGRTKFTLVAHDWGGVVAWVFAAQHPEMLDNLVIVNAPHPTIFGRLLRDDPDQQKASQYMLMFRSPAAEATLSQNNYEALVTAVLGGGLASGTITEQDKKEYLAAWSQPGALTGGLNYYRAAQIGPPAPAPGAVPSQEAALAAAPPMVVRVPTLVIWGEKDTALLTSNLNGLDQVVPKLTVKRIPDGTHWVVRENAPEVNRLIREYLAQP
jgi:pimeloyl-ACP methyl ester carboxylesterase